MTHPTPSAETNKMPWRLYPLTRVRRDGGKYAREAAVDTQIMALSAMSERARRQRLERDQPAGSPDRLREETLVWALRAAAACHDQEMAWSIAERLVERVSGHVARQVARWRLSPEDADDCAQDLFAALYDALFDVSPAGEFWEVRFWVCLDRRLWNLIERRQTAIDLRALEEDSVFDDEEREARVLRIADPTPGPEALAYRQEALKVLAEHERLAVYLKYVEGLPEESDDPDRVTVAKLLGVTGRSVRNYLRRAEQKLKEWESDERDK